MLKSDVRVVLPALPVAVRPVPAISLAEMGDPAIVRSLDQQRFEDFRLQMALRIEADQRVFRARFGEQTRKELLDTTSMRPLAAPLFARKQSHFATDCRSRSGPTPRQ